MKRFLFPPCSFITPVLLSCIVFHSTVMKTWWTRITWPSVLALHWCLSQRYRIKCPARLMWMRLSKPSSSTMRLFSQMLKSWMALFMRNVWLETSIGKSKNFSPSFSSWKKLYKYRYQLNLKKKELTIRCQCFQLKKRISRNTWDKLEY